MATVGGGKQINGWRNLSCSLRTSWDAAWSDTKPSRRSRQIAFNLLKLIPKATTPRPDARSAAA
eukprot:scaffold28518_cov131-Isochrysis_galbana.AAC.3